MKLTLLSSLLFIAFTSSAQIKKGAVSLGVDFNFSGSKSTASTGNSEAKNTGGFISVSGGKAVQDNLFVGAGLSYGISNNKNIFSGNTMSEQDAHSVGGSVWVRKYYPVLKSFYLFINGGLYASSYSTENKQAAVVATKSNSFNLSAIVYPGISYQMRKNFFLDASINSLANLSYSHGKNETFDSQGNSTGITKSNNYGLSTSIGNSANPLQIGVRWIIQK